jgi:UPF0716 protein FxsA
VNSSIFPKLLFFFIAVPLLEMIILIKVGTLIGVFETLSIIVVTGFIGAWLAKKEGTEIFFRIRDKWASGNIPLKEISHGLLILISGILLITPGFLTDLFGFSILLPSLRDRYISILKKLFGNRI